MLCASKLRCSLSAEEALLWQKLILHSNKIYKEKKIREKSLQQIEEEKRKQLKEKKIKEMIHLFSTRLF